MGENICKWTITKYWPPKYISSLCSSISKHKQPNQKMSKDLDRHFFKDNTQMTNKRMKRCLTSLIMREMQIETIVRCHITPNGHHQKKNLQAINAGENVEKRENFCFVGGNISWNNHYRGIGTSEPYLLFLKKSLIAFCNCTVDKCPKSPWYCTES